MKKYTTKELKEEVEAAQKYYFSEPKDLLGALSPHRVEEYLLKKENPKISDAANDATTLEKFEGHLDYKGLVNDLYFPRGPLKKVKKDFVDIRNYLDTWYEEPLYGRVCTKNNLIYTSYFLYTDISVDTQECICVFDFVANAFGNMKDIFGKIKVSQKSRFLKELKAKRGACSTINLEEKYVAYLDNVFNGFLSTVGYDLRYSKKIKDYDSFYNIFVNYLINNNISFTFTNFAEGPEANIYDSYLAFDIKEPTAEDSDKEKLDFLNDLNYPAYAFAAKEAGFKIDPNRPWRLIADLSSDRFLDAIKMTWLMRGDEAEVGNNEIKFLKIYRETLQQGASKSSSLLEQYQEAQKLPNTLEDDAKERINKIKKIEVQIEKEVQKFKNLVKTFSSKYNYPGTAIDDLNGEDTVEGEVNLMIALIEIYIDFTDFKENDYISKIQLIKNVGQRLLFAFMPNLKVQTIYEKIYYNIYDYPFFSYFPRKSVEFYNKYVKKYPVYGAISFQNKKGFTKFDKDVRKPHILVAERVSQKEEYELYKLKYLQDYIRIRNSETSQQANQQFIKTLQNEIKSLYSAAHSAIGDAHQFKKIKNLMIQLIEFSFGTPYNKTIPNKEIYEKKQSHPLFLLKEAWFNSAEPRIFQKRVCLRPDEPLLEEAIPDDCLPFPIALPGSTYKIKVYTPPPATDEPEPEPVSQPVPQPFTGVTAKLISSQPLSETTQCKGGVKGAGYNKYSRGWSECYLDPLGNFWMWRQEYSSPCAAPAAPTAGEKQPEGGKCTKNSDCLSSKCTGVKVSQPGWCVGGAKKLPGPGGTQCGEKKPVGAPCKGHGDCVSNKCILPMANKPGTCGNYDPAGIFEKSWLQAQLPRNKGQWYECKENCKGKSFKALQANKSLINLGPEYSCKCPFNCKPPMIKVASEAELCEGAREILKVIMKLNKIDPPKYNGKNIIDMTCKEVAIAMNALQG